MYIDESLRRYLDDLGAKKSAPGGGSVAALSASLGTSLMSMVANYTIGKAADSSAETLICEMLAAVKKHDERLRELIDRDVDAYERLSKGLKALAASRDDDARDELFKEAIEPPFLVCEISHNCLKLCGLLAEHGNKKLITDTAIAAIMLESAFFSAKYNVYVNLGCIKDTGYIAKVHKVISPLERDMPKLKEEVLGKCEDIIRRM